MKKLLEKLKSLLKRLSENAISKERLAVFICIPITVLSVAVSTVLLYGNGRDKKQNDIKETNEGQFMFEESKDIYSTNNALEYQSIGDGNCLVMGIGSCKDSEIVIPSKSPSGDRVVGIGNGAFENCKHLVSISIPESVTTIGVGVFRGCSSLVIISVESDNEIYSSSGGILYSKNKQRLICCPASRIGENYLLDPNVKVIDDYAFEGVKNMCRVLYEKSTADFESISIGKGNEDFLELPITCNYFPSK
ncbi:MAG: hypothetical protein E7642_01410 [Ruminococcaceae bacterium]|nr:hypothetical protein [Oscillospiraceae bacterium]